MALIEQLWCGLKIAILGIYFFQCRGIKFLVQEVQENLILGTGSAGMCRAGLPWSPPFLRQFHRSIQDFYSLVSLRFKWTKSQFPTHVRARARTYFINIFYFYNSERLCDLSIQAYRYNSLNELSWSIHLLTTIIGDH